MKDFSYIFNANPSYIDSIYSKYIQNPTEVDQEWRLFFEGFEFGNKNGSDSGTESISSTKEFGVLHLINGFRTRGHLLSDTNPIQQRRDHRPHLDLADYGLSNADLSTVFRAAEVVGLKNATLQQLIDHLKTIYAGSIGFEYAHIENKERREWLQARIEKQTSQGGYGLEKETKTRILQKLNGASIFEKFLHTKYIGQKRFSLEGGETTIPALDAIINKGAELSVDEVVIGMAHRGRLNVLANIMGKTYEQIFNEFEGNSLPDQSFGDGDVKYHLGFSSEVTTTSGKKVNLKLAPNPSHLEAVNTVVQGMARASADLLYESDYDRILPILIHGDAAIAGQGIAYETVQMSKLEGYYTGGTIHFVINNQIGFTTDFDDARSSTYCTAAASLVQAPVFHVNGDDPEAVIFAAQMAIEYRQAFNNDVFIDMVCYRRHGHNEGDDPKFTQPRMYDLINSHKNPRELYVDRLVSRGDIDKEIGDKLEKDFWSDLQDRLNNVKEKPLPYLYQAPEKAWQNLRFTSDFKDFDSSPKTGVAKKTIEKILKHLSVIPDSFTPLSKVNRLQKGTKKLIDAKQLDWALAELAAYGTILLENKDVRISGQDVKRGTFSHRHAVFNDAKTFEEYNRLNNIDKKQGSFRIFNSLLSEFGVLGFEYGYSLMSPDNLVLWEAQFGDFYNGAQTIVDQFISAAESKWQRMSGLVMLLPHGMEGQGPEHSSSRLERFLQLCAECNMTVANITTPANFFHALRRQIARPFRKPLVVMSPKSLLRHPRCLSSIDDFTTKHGFQEVIKDETVTASKVTRHLLCSGKIYYDLLKYREENPKFEHVAITRIEQLYPLPEKQLNAIFKAYKNVPTYWVQEENINMGSWTYLLPYWRKTDIEPIARDAAASPATGFKKVHEKQQADLVKRAFTQK